MADALIGVLLPKVVVEVKIKYHQAGIVRVKSAWSPWYHFCLGLLG